MFVSYSENENDWWRWLCLGPLAAILTSFVASATVLVWLHRLKAAGKKLMARQLWHLELANFIECGMMIIYAALDPLNLAFGVGSERAVILDKLCQFGMWNNAAFMTSLVLEVHIAMATAAALCRSNTVLRALSRSVAFCFLPGIAMGALVAYPSGSHWDSAVGSCNTSDDVGERFKASVMTLALVACVAAYGVGFVRAWNRSISPVQANIWARAKFFLAAAIVSWFPFLLFTHMNSGALVTGEVGRTGHYITDTFFFLNGLLNACVYAARSHIIAGHERHKQPRPVSESVCSLECSEGLRRWPGLRSGAASEDEVEATQADEHNKAQRHTAAAEVEPQPLLRDLEGLGSLSEADLRQRKSGLEAELAKIDAEMAARMEEGHWCDELLAQDLFGCFDELPPLAPPDTASRSSASMSRSRIELELSSSHTR